MNKTKHKHKNWWQRNWKWCIPFVVITSGLILILFSSIGNTATDISKAYAQKALFKDAFDIVKNHTEASSILGELAPMDNLAILEGSVYYSNDNKSFKSSTRIVGSKARGKMDISADNVDDIWVYKLIKVRVKKPEKQRQTIDILDVE
jgi:hypothetical protein